MRNLYIDTCAQFSVHWGTGNAVGTLENLFTTTSGWVNDVTNAADTYAAAKGANVYVQAGVLNISNYISGSPLPSKTADIYQASGQVNISQTWQENGSYAFYQASASQNGGVYMPSVIEGINHYSGSFTRDTNPDSLAITSPGTTVSGCRVYGDVSVLSGLGGKPVFSGINFIDAAAVYKGSGIDTQRSLIDIGHVGNYAQVALGGRNSGMTLADVGYLVPQLLSMGAGTSADAVAILQALGAASGSSGFTMTLEPTNGGLNVFVNCYVYDAAYNFRAHKAGSAFRVILGGGTNALKIYAYDFADTTTSVAYTSFVDLGGVKVGGGAGYYTEAVLMPPLRAAAPTYSSGNWWEGGIYYNTTTNKLQVNTGAGTWETITST